MSGRVVYCNGRFIPEHEAGVSLFDSGLLYGDMAFEMTRTFRQQPFHMTDHLARLYATLDYLEIDPGLTLEALHARTLDTLALNLRTEAADVDWHIRHDISRGPAELFADTFPAGVQPTVLISCWPLLKHLGRFAPNYERGVPVIVSPQPALPASLVDPRAKTRSRVHFQLAALHARRHGGGAWPVLVDPDGFLTEGPSWNIFLVEGGTLYTPESRHILNGVSRAITLDSARNLGIPVRETNLDRPLALRADEILCTATSFGLVHAAYFEGQPINGGKPGPIGRQLAEAWKEIVGLDFVAQAHSYAARVDDWEAREKAAARSRVA